MYPIKFNKVYKERIWGGNRLGELLGGTLPGTRIGESWELCCHPNGMSVVANGSLAGKTLAELLIEYPYELMGGNFRPNDRFPLLIKAIDANDNLSVQVHPDDDYAYRGEKEAGKTEAWYVLDAKNEAKIIYGLKEGVSKEDFLEAIQSNRLMESLRVVPVKKGDMIYVPAGLVHALLEGIVVYEVQQNSDTTYRVYDYGRVDKDGQARELHLDKALDVIQFGDQENIDFSNQEIVCPYFKMKYVRIQKHWSDHTNNDLVVYLLVAGSGELIFQDGKKFLTRGETVLLPASLGEMEVKGNLEILRITSFPTKPLSAASLKLSLLA